MMTPRQRMLRAYRGEAVDRAPVAPGRYERRTEVRCDGRTLTWRHILDAEEPSWIVERPIKDFDADWPAYERATLAPPEALDWAPVQRALDAVGEDYLLEVFVGFPFIDFAGEPRQGGLEQVIMDLYDRDEEMRALQARYSDYLGRKIRTAFENTTAQSVFVASGWSSMSLLSPTIWRQWEQPVLAAAVEATHACGGLIHHHFHGRCMAVLPELAALGFDCLCPFERPPGGDVTSLAVVRDALAGRTTFNGNVHTVETLINGTPEDVRREVGEILTAFEGSPRLIVGTGDQVGAETPDENIAAMIEAVHTMGNL
jgi:uroporphyrinogen-III decarboxylase